jgi:hypothetical protein
VLRIGSRDFSELQNLEFEIPDADDGIVLKQGGNVIRVGYLTIQELNSIMELIAEEVEEKSNNYIDIVG